MIKKLVIALGGLLAVIAIIAGVFFSIINTLQAAGSPPMPPSAVTITEAKREQWNSVLTTVGSLTAVQGTVVSAEADGVVREILFEPGRRVEAGTLLVKLDTDVEDAQLRAAEAAADWARTSLKRAQELLDSRTISQAELDSAEAAVKQAEAQADNIRAMIGRKFVRAPFTGRLGIREISLGQYLNRGSPVVSLQAFDPVFAEFALPQQYLSQLGNDLEVNVELDAFPGETFTGKITALNPQVDPRTRNLRIQATVPNADGRLRPGMFVEIEVVLPQKKDVVIVPLTSVLRATHGTSVFVVVPGETGPAQVAKRVAVRTGDTRGDFVVITEGLQGGEKVVSSGAFKLQEGMAVVESSTGSTTPSAQPKVENT